MSSNFSELKNRINDWSFEDDDKLVLKIANYCERYEQNLKKLSENFLKIESHIEKADLDYYNNVNFLKNVSIKKFVEHIINQEENRPYDIASRKSQSQVLTKDELDTNIFNKYKNSLTTSLDLIPTRSTNNNPEREHTDSISIADDDNVSVTSSKYFSNKNHKGVKIPFIIGTPEFSKNDFLGIVLEDKKNLPVASVNFKKDSVFNSEQLAKDLGFSNNFNNTNFSSNQNISPSISNVTRPPGIPSIPSVPSIPNVPRPPGIQSIPGVPSIPNIPRVPGVPSVPGVPNIPGVSGVPGVPGVPRVPINTDLKKQELNNKPISNLSKPEEKVEDKKVIASVGGNLMEEIRMAALRRKTNTENAIKQNLPSIQKQNESANLNVPTTVNQPIINAVPKIVNQPIIKTVPTTVNQPIIKTVPTLNQFVRNGTNLFEDEDPMFTKSNDPNKRDDKEKKQTIFDDNILKKGEIKLTNVKIDEKIEEKPKMNIKDKLSKLFDFDEDDVFDEKPLEKSSADIANKLSLILNEDKKVIKKEIKQPENIFREAEVNESRITFNKQVDLFKNNEEIKKPEVVAQSSQIKPNMKKLLMDDDEKIHSPIEMHSNEVKKENVVSKNLTKDSQVRPQIQKHSNEVAKKENVVNKHHNNESISSVFSNFEDGNIKIDTTEREKVRGSIRINKDFTKAQNALAGKMNFNPGMMIMGGDKVSNIPLNNAEPFITNEDIGFEEMIVDRSSKVIPAKKKPRMKAFNDTSQGNFSLTSFPNKTVSIAENNMQKSFSNSSFNMTQDNIRLSNNDFEVKLTKKENEEKLIIKENEGKSTKKENRKSFFFEDD